MSALDTLSGQSEILTLLEGPKILFRIASKFSGAWSGLGSYSDLHTDGRRTASTRFPLARNIAAEDPESQINRMLQPSCTSSDSRRQHSLVRRCLRPNVPSWKGSARHRRGAADPASLGPLSPYQESCLHQGEVIEKDFFVPLNFSSSSPAPQVHIHCSQPAYGSVRLFTYGGLSIPWQRWAECWNSWEPVGISTRKNVLPRGTAGLGCNPEYCWHAERAGVIPDKTNTTYSIFKGGGLKICLFWSSEKSIVDHMRLIASTHCGFPSAGVLHHATREVVCSW